MGCCYTFDADLNKRALALATTGGMWLKTKLGMSLDIKPGLKFLVYLKFNFKFYFKYIVDVILNYILNFILNFVFMNGV